MSHKVKLSNRREYDNGLVKYNVKVFYDSDGDGEKELVFDGDYGVSKRQEEMDKFDNMMQSFAAEKIDEYENDKGRDHSGKTLEV